MLYKKIVEARMCLTILFLTYGCSFFAQVNCVKESMMYLKAYNYIAKDIKSSMYVSDTIVCIDGIFFLTELTDFPIEKERIEQSHIEHYTNNKEQFLSEFLYSSCLATTFPRKDSVANYIVFYSPIDENILFASVFPTDIKNFNPYKEQNLFSFNNASRFTTEQRYLFIFNMRKLRLSKVFKTIIYVD